MAEKLAHYGDEVKVLPPPPPPHPFMPERVRQETTCFMALGWHHMGDAREI